MAAPRQASATYRPHNRVLQQRDHEESDTDDLEPVRTRIYADAEAYRSERHGKQAKGGPCWTDFANHLLELLSGRQVSEAGVGALVGIDWRRG